MIANCRHAFRFRHINRLTAFRARQLQGGDGTLGLFVVHGLLLGHVGSGARRLGGLEVLRWLLSTSGDGIVFLHGLLRLAMFQRGRNQCGFPLIHGGNRLVGVAICRRLNFGNLQDGMLAIKDFRRVLSSIYRMRRAVLRVSNVSHARPTVFYGYLLNGNFFLVVSLHCNASAGLCLIVFSGAGFCSIRCAPCHSRARVSGPFAESYDHAFYRSVADCRVGTRQVRGLYCFL